MRYFRKVIPATSRETYWHPSMRYRFLDLSSAVGMQEVESFESNLRGRRNRYGD